MNKDQKTGVNQLLKFIPEALLANLSAKTNVKGSAWEKDVLFATIWHIRK